MQYELLRAASSVLYKPIPFASTKQYKAPYMEQRAVALNVAFLCLPLTQIFEMLHCVATSQWRCCLTFATRARSTVYINFIIVFMLTMAVIIIRNQIHRCFQVHHFRHRHRHHHIIIIGLLPPTMSHRWLSTCRHWS